MKIKDKAIGLVYGIIGRYMTLEAEVEVVSPFFPSRVTIYLNIFGRYRYETEHYKLPLTEDLRVDLEGIMDSTPVSRLTVEYPDRWSFWRIKTLFEEGLMDEEEVKLSEYPEVLDKETIIEFERGL